MLATWDLFVDGTLYTVSVERMPNGKDSIRVNGRIAAQPMGSDDQERELSVGGTPHIVRRAGTDGFQIAVDERADVKRRTQATAKAVLAHAADSPLPMVKSQAPGWLPVAGWAAVVAIVAIVLVYATGPSYKKQAATRMQQVLHEMQSGKDAEMQFAVCLWAMNVRVLDLQSMSVASDHFDKWRQAKNLYGRAFTRYKIVSSEEVKDQKVPTAIVTFTIEDEQYKVRVPERREISWEN